MKGLFRIASLSLRCRNCNRIMEDVQNRPFVDLVRFIEENRIQLKKIQRMESHEAEVNDSLLFKNAMKDVKLVRKKKTAIKRIPPCPVVSREHKKDDVLFEKLLRENQELNVIGLPEFMEGFAEGINPLILEKLKKGEFSVQRILDLHGFSVTDSADLFHEFMNQAVHDGLKCVKIIHGRGLKSKKTPVLRENLKAWIIKAMHRKWVIAFSNAIMAEGGPGATYILLKKHPKKRKIRILG